MKNPPTKLSDIEQGDAYEFGDIKFIVGKVQDCRSQNVIIIDPKCVSMDGRCEKIFVPYDQLEKVKPLTEVEAQELKVECL